MDGFAGPDDGLETAWESAGGGVEGEEVFGDGEGRGYC